MRGREVRNVYFNLGSVKRRSNLRQSGENNAKRSLFGVILCCRFCTIFFIFVDTLVLLIFLLNWHELDVVQFTNVPLPIRRIDDNKNQTVNTISWTDDDGVSRSIGSRWNVCYLILNAERMLRRRNKSTQGMIVRETEEENEGYRPVLTFQTEEIHHCPPNKRNNRASSCGLTDKEIKIIARL